MCVQQGTKAPFFLSLFIFALGTKAKTIGTVRVAGLKSFGTICIGQYHWVLCVKGCHATDLKSCHERMSFL